MRSFLIFFSIIFSSTYSLSADSRFWSLVGEASGRELLLSLRPLPGNGFGGGGGFLFCQRSVEEDFSCSSLIELGLRFDFPSSQQVLDLPQSLFSFGAAPEGSVDFIPSEGFKAELSSAQALLEEQEIASGDQLEFFLFGNQQKVKLIQLSVENFNESLVGADVFKRAEEEYLNLLKKPDLLILAGNLVAPGSGDQNPKKRFLGCPFSEHSPLMESCLYIYKPLAISATQSTVLFDAFSSIGPRRQLLTLLHEGSIRKCYLERKTNCLLEALYFDGLFYEVLSGNKISELERKRLAHHIDGPIFDW